MLSTARVHYNRSQCSQNSIGLKMAMGRIITLTCKNSMELMCNQQTPLEIEKIIREITYLDQETIKSYILSATLKRSFAYCLRKTNIKQICKFPHEYFRHIIYKLYLKDDIVPTKDKLLSYIRASSKLNSNYFLVNLNEDLKGNGFVLKKLDKSKKALIVEEPKQIYKRMKYLNKIRNYRLLKKNFIYVLCKRKHEKFSIAVSPESSVLSFNHHMVIDGDATKQVITFLESLIPSLPPSSVVIIEAPDVQEASPPPNQYSTKQQMEEWLDKHSLPYETKAHTAELYSLIQKFAPKRQETCEVRELLESQGFDVLKVPAELPSLSYYNPIFNQIKDTPYFTEAQHFKNIFGKSDKNNLCSLEDKLKEEEIKIYCEDLEMEKIIDTIRMAATRTILPGDMKSCAIYDMDTVPSYIILD